MPDDNHMRNELERLRTAFLASAERGDLDAALADLDRAVALAPDNLGIRIIRGTVHGLRRNYAQAVTDLEHVVSRDPSQMEAWLRLGESQHELRDYDAAVASFTRATDLDSSSTEALLGRGKALHKKRRFDDAIADYVRATKLVEDSSEVDRYRAAAAAKKDYEDTLAKHTKNILDAMAGGGEFEDDKDDDGFDSSRFIARMTEAYDVTLPERYQRFLRNNEFKQLQNKCAGSVFGCKFVVHCTDRRLADVGDLLSDIDMGHDGDEWRQSNPGMIPFATLVFDELPDYQAEAGQFFVLDTRSPACPILWCNVEAELEEEYDSLDAFVGKISANADVDSDDVNDA